MSFHLLTKVQIVLPSNLLRPNPDNMDLQSSFLPYIYYCWLTSESSQTPRPSLRIWLPLLHPVPAEWMELLSSPSPFPLCPGSHCLSCLCSRTLTWTFDLSHHFLPDQLLLIRVSLVTSWILPNLCLALPSLLGIGVLRPVLSKHFYLHILSNAGLHLLLRRPVPSLCLSNSKLYLFGELSFVISQLLHTVHFTR